MLWKTVPALRKTSPTRAKCLDAKTLFAFSTGLYSTHAQPLWKTAARTTTKHCAKRDQRVPSA